jgi:hypothetical protein
MVSIVDYAAIASAVGIILGTIFVLFQVWHMEKHRNVEVSMRLFEWAGTDRLRKALRWVENEFQFDDYEKYKAREATSLEVRESPLEVTSFFEQMGFLVEKKFVDLDVIVDRLGSDIVANWKKLEPWIMALRKEKHNQTFGEHFQKLYVRTVEYMKRGQ